MGPSVQTRVLASAVVREGPAKVWYAVADPNASSHAPPEAAFPNSHCAMGLGMMRHNGEAAMAGSLRIW